MTKERICAVLMAMLFMSVAPAMADHMGFSYAYLHTTFDGTTFATTDSANTSGTVYRLEPPPGQATFISAGEAAAFEALLGLPAGTVPTWGSGNEALVFSMTISDITATAAMGVGSFVLTDVDGDTLSGTVSGTWAKVSSRAEFTGSLADVIFTSNVDNTFDGHVGSTTMVFSQPQPWSGSVVQLNGGNGWFTQPFTGNGGSIDAVLPAPAAVLLGLLGLSAAGVKLRRHV